MKPHVFGQVVTNPEMRVCGRCGGMPGYFINLNGTTYCPKCPELQTPPVVTVSTADVARWVAEVSP